jgi:GR25 family glycosyltransferase involved in LPS biosynthesis
VLNDKFQKIYCINLDRRTDRWKDASELFQSYGIEVERVSGIEDEIPWNGLRKTVIGIFKRAIEEGLETILIFEDDIDWSNDFSNSFERCWNSLPDDWDMFYFSAAHQYWPPKHNDLLFKLTWSTAAHAIGFKRRCFDAVLHDLENSMDAIDVIYSRLQTRLNAYCCINPIAWQRRSFSDIEREEKWYPYLKDINFYHRYMHGLVTIDDEEVQPPPEGNQ